VHAADQRLQVAEIAAAEQRAEDRQQHHGAELEIAGHVVELGPGPHAGRS